MTERLRPALTTYPPAPAHPPPRGAPWRGHHRYLAGHSPGAWLLGILLLVCMAAVPAADIMPYDLTEHALMVQSSHELVAA